MIKIEQFLKDFSLNDNTREMLNDIWKQIDLYIHRLEEYPKEAQKVFLKDYLIKENINSSNLECELYSDEVLKLYDKKFFVEKYLDKDRVQQINKTVRKRDEILNFEKFEIIRKEKNKDITYEEYVQNEKRNLDGNYRNEIVWIGGKEGMEYAFHIPPKPEEIEEYMQDFFDFFNTSHNGYLQDPIVKAALLHVIFIKIHPFANGNGRTARILLNYYLSCSIRKMYNLDSKYTLLNLSKSFDLTRTTYFEKQNNIIFKEGVDNSEAINSWIKYNIIAIEEQLYYLNNRLNYYDEFLKSGKIK